MKSFLLVFLGGGLGSGLRYLVTITMNQYSKVLPFGTFTINMLGCLLIGLILGIIFILMRYYLKKNKVL